jgi:hypothetical protein
VVGWGWNGKIRVAHLKKMMINVSDKFGTGER